MATTLEMLLAAIGGGNLPPLPDPANPVGIPLAPAPAPPVNVGPSGPMPGAAPQAPLPALDTNLINQLAGPAPVAPTIQEPGFLEKLSTALLGINAGFQGRGGQFVESVKEQRQRPIKEYNAQLERFNQRRTQGVEFATRKQEREQDRATRQAEQQADREFQAWARRANITDEQALLQARQAFDLQKIREQERILDERQAAREKAEQEKQRRAIESELATKGGAPPSIAKEISEYQVGLRPTLSKSAEKWRTLQARKAEAQLARVAGGGGSGGGQVMAQLANGQVVPASLVSKETGAVMLGGQSVPVVQYVGGNIPSRPATPTSNVKGVGPEGFPLALGTPGAPQVETLPGGIRMTTPAATPNRATAKAKLVRAGYSSAQADKELDRLGIR